MNPDPHRPLERRSGPPLSVSGVVDVVAELETLNHSKGLKQTLDRSAGNETKADVLGVGVLACVI